MASTPPAKRAKTYENGNIKLYRSYTYQVIPDIAFYGTSKDEIKPYIKDKMQQERTYSPSYYEFKLNKDDYKLLDLSSDEGQVLLKTLFKENENVMKKAFQLENDKYIRKSDGKGDDEEAFKLIRDELSKEDESKSYVGTMTLPSVRLSHSEIVIFNNDLIAKLNSEANKKTDIVVTPKVIRKQRRSRPLEINTSKKTLSFNNSSESETENVEELLPLSLNFPSLLDNTQDNIEGSPVKERQSRTSYFSGVPKKLFGGGKRRSVKKSKNQKKTKRNNSTNKRRRTKKKKSSKN
jgi:hypothetical protein